MQKTLLVFKFKQEQKTPVFADSNYKREMLLGVFFF